MIIRIKYSETNYENILYNHSSPTNSLLFYNGCTNSRFNANC